MLTSRKAPAAITISDAGASHTVPEEAHADTGPHAAEPASRTAPRCQPREMFVRLPRNAMDCSPALRYDQPDLSQCVADITDGHSQGSFGLPATTPLDSQDSNLSDNPGSSNAMPDSGCGDTSDSAPAMDAAPSGISMRDITEERVRQTNEYLQHPENDC